jgi:hypothetical protein
VYFYTPLGVDKIKRLSRMIPPGKMQYFYSFGSTEEVEQVWNTKE